MVAGPIGDGRHNGHDDDYPHGHLFVDVGISVDGKCNRERPTASIINNSTNANRLLFKPTHVIMNCGFYGVGGNSCYHNATSALCPLGGCRWPRNSGTAQCRRSVTARCVVWLRVGFKRRTNDKLETNFLTSTSVAIQWSLTIQVVCGTVLAQVRRAHLGAIGRDKDSVGIDAW